MATTSAKKDAPPVRRPRGRPRDPRVEGAVLGATRELLLERGYGGLTIAAVADAAGVGKGTIYLRWPDKEALVVGALAEVWEPVADIDSGNLRDDLLGILTTSVRGMNGRDGRMFTEIVAELSRSGPLKTYWRNEISRPWVEVVTACFKRGIARGEMRADVDIQAAIEVLLSPPSSVGMMSDKKITARQVNAWLDIFLKGVAP